ncbi:MAG: hypothetical protein HOQ24_06720, partial [Mycobacteriaceae bacterium]|nr:hypothetical protein [Mycobacteriaceae bacterium]
MTENFNPGPGGAPSNEPPKQAGAAEAPSPSGQQPMQHEPWTPPRTDAPTQAFPTAEPYAAPPAAGATVFPQPPFPGGPVPP